jgi:phenylalanyl-tRNA synthetase beta chain
MRRLFQSDAGAIGSGAASLRTRRAPSSARRSFILEICGGRGSVNRRQGSLPERAPVRLRGARVEKLLGVAISPDAIADIFTRLRLPHARSGDDFVVTPPSYRFDIALEEDLVEEVARIYGYDAIPATPRAHVQTMLPSPEAHRSAFALRRTLVSRDWQEIVTFSFVNGDDERALDPAAKPIAVLNPIAAHLDVMRTTLLPGLLGVLQTNVKRKLSRVRVFEVGRVFARDGFAQPLRIGGLAFGASEPEQWGTRARNIVFFDVKADVEALAAPLSLVTVANAMPWLHPGRSAAVRVNGALSGWIGELHPRLVRHFELPTAPTVFEIDLAALTTVPLPDARVVSRLPSLRRDIAIVINENIAVGDVIKVARELEQPEVETLDVFDVYRGNELPNGRKSVAILVVMRDTERTLTDADGDRIVAQLVSTLSDRFGATLRSQTSP